jgi:uncharacterized protein
MLNELEPILISQLLQQRGRCVTLELQDHLADLETLTPVQGWLRVIHQGNYLEVQGKADTIKTLTCDRCLCQYNYRLAINLTELIWLTDDRSSLTIPEDESGGKLDDLVETLSPQGYFDASQWLYEQLCLALPPVQRCDLNCPGLQSSATDTADMDQRWAALDALRRSLSN